jgi:hypothetical protein
VPGVPTGMERTCRSDKDWTTFFKIILKPNPKLSPAQREVVALGYGMEDGVCGVPIRMALLYYFDKRLGCCTTLLAGGWISYRVRRSTDAPGPLAQPDAFPLPADCNP